MHLRYADHFRILLLLLVVSSLSGCGTTERPESTKSAKAGSKSKKKKTNSGSNSRADVRKITLYLPQMNKKLNILWGDWPNKVKKALLELNGVSLVEDEWERELELDSDDDLDLLFIEFDPGKISLEKIQAEIKKFEFDAEVRPEPKASQ